MCLCAADVAVEMASYELAAGANGHWCLPRVPDRLRGANLRAVRRSHHVYFVPRRRAHAHTQDAHTSANRVQPHRRCVPVASHHCDVIRHLSRDHSTQHGRFPMCDPSVKIKPLDLVFEIFSVKYSNIMKSWRRQSPLTSSRLDQLSVWIVKCHPVSLRTKKTKNAWATDGDPPQPYGGNLLYLRRSPRPLSRLGGVSYLPTLASWRRLGAYFVRSSRPQNGQAPAIFCASRRLSLWRVTLWW